MKRKLTPDELNELEQQGYNTSSYKGELVEFPDPEPQSSVSGAITRGVLAEAVPATAGAASFAGGAAASAPLAAAAVPVLGPFAAGIPIVSGLAASMLGSGLARKAQEVIIPDAWNEQLAIDAAEHPIASRIGGLGAMALTMRPSVGVTKEALKAASTLPTSVGAFRAITPEGRAALANVGLGAGISGATEAGRELMTGEDFSPSRILGEAAIGAAFNKPTALGRKVMGIGPEIAPRDITSPEKYRRTLADYVPPQQDEQVKVFRQAMATQASFNEAAVDMAKQHFDTIAKQNAQIEQLKQTQDELMRAVDSVVWGKEPVPAAKVEDIVPVKEEPKKPESTQLTAEERDELSKMVLNQESNPRATTPLQEEVQTAVNKMGKSGETVTPANKQLLTEHLTKKNIGTEENAIMDEKGFMIPSGAERKVTINPLKEDITTRAHEGLHWMRTELEAEARAGNKNSQKLLAQLDKAQEAGRAAYNAKRAQNNLPPVDAHEFSVNQQGWEFVKQQLNIGKETGMKRWWNDTKALWKTRFGKEPSEADLRRALNFRFVNEEGMGSVGKRGPLGEVGQPVGAVAGSGDISGKRESEGGTKTPEEMGYRKVNVRRPDGSTYEAYFNDQYYDFGPMGKFASIAKVQGDGLTHGTIKKGESIEEITRPQGKEEGFKDDDRPFMTSTERVISSTFKGAQNGRQMLNTIKNKIPPAEWDMLTQAGIEKEFEGRIVKPEEMRKWVEENGPKVEVHSYGMEGKVSKEKQELDKLNHEWMDNLPSKMVDDWVASLEHDDDVKQYQSLVDKGWDEQNLVKAKRMIELDRAVTYDKNKGHVGPFATSAYTTVSPKDVKKFPVQRVDVVLPYDKSIGGAYGISGDARAGIKWQPDNLHENLPNTLGWAAIQYETLPNGEKVAHLFEVQSRRGQRDRDAKSQYEVYKKGDKWASAHVEGNTREDIVLHNTEAEAKQRINELTADTHHPLLKDYNRLILKAAIEQARKEGATHIAISDAETAMMTEGHDLQGYDHFGEAVFPSETIAKQNLNKLPIQERNLYTVEKRSEHEWWLRPVQSLIKQEPGMRFNYDTALPRIAEELTGSKGERVSFGEHKNALLQNRGDVREDLAFPHQDRTTAELIVENNPQYEIRELVPRDDKFVDVVTKQRKLRDNLIFKNADGTPKTDVTALVYPLGKAAKKEQPFSLFERRSQGAEEGFVDAPVETNTDTTRKSFIRPLEATFDKVERVSKEHAQAARNFEARKDSYVGMGNAALTDLSKFDRDTVNKVMAAHRDAYRNNTEPVLESDAEKAVSAILTNYYSAIADTRRNLGIKIDGREAGKNPYYVPDMLSAETVDLFVNHPTSPEALYAKNQWAEHVFEESGRKIPMEKIRSDISDYISALGGKNNNYRSVEFGAIRRASGFGLPESLRDTDAISSLARYSRRAANDLAFFQEIQNRPEIAGPLKIKNQEGELWSGYGDSALSESKEIKDMMSFITGSVTGRQSSVTPKVNAVVRLVNNALLGPATGIRDLVSVPVNAIPYIHSFSDLGAAWKGLLSTRENSRAALETAARQPNIDRVAFNDILSQPDRFVSVVGRVADGLRKYQGREALENLSRDIVFSVGKELGRNNILGAKAGNKKSVEWLKKFSDLVEGDVTTMEGEALEKALNQIGKNFTDRNQGTYGGRGLPLGVLDSQFAPFLSLQKWSIEKSNVIYKDVVKPFITGENHLPLLTYTLGSFMTGAAIQELNKVLSGRKGQDPDIKEALAKGDAASIVQELATIMQLGSFGGIVSDGMKAIADTTIRGKTPRNIVSFPTATAAVKTQESITDAMEAIRQGEEPWSVVKALSLDLMVNNVQAARMLANHTWKDEDIERSDKFRDLRVYKELEGAPAGSFSRTNPYLSMEEREFKRTGDLGKAQKIGKKLLQEKVKESKGNPEKLKGELASLKANSYQTMPSPETSPEEFSKFYSFLVKTQGKEAANQRVVDYLTQNAKNKVKSSMIP